MLSFMWPKQFKPLRFWAFHWWPRRKGIGLRVLGVTWGEESWNDS